MSRRYNVRALSQMLDRLKSLDGFYQKILPSHSYFKQSFNSDERIQNFNRDEYKDASEGGVILEENLYAGLTPAEKVQEVTDELGIDTFFKQSYSVKYESNPDKYRSEKVYRYKTSDSMQKCFDILRAKKYWGLALDLKYNYTMVTTWIYYDFYTGQEIGGDIYRDDFTNRSLRYGFNLESERYIIWKHDDLLLQSTPQTSSTSIVSYENIMLYEDPSNTNDAEKWIASTMWPYTTRELTGYEANGDPVYESFVDKLKYTVLSPHWSCQSELEGLPLPNLPQILQDAYENTYVQQVENSSDNGDKSMSVMKDVQTYAQMADICGYPSL